MAILDDYQGAVIALMNIAALELPADDARLPALSASVNTLDSFLAKVGRVLANKSGQVAAVKQIGEELVANRIAR